MGDESAATKPLIDISYFLNLLVFIIAILKFYSGTSKPVIFPSPMLEKLRNVVDRSLPLELLQCHDSCIELGNHSMVSTSNPT